MNELKRTAGRAIAVILAVAATPFVIWGASSALPYITELAKTVGKASAMLSFINSKDAVSSFKEISNSINNAVTSISTIDYPMINFTLPQTEFQIGNGSAWDIDMAPDEIETPSKTPPLPTPSDEILSALPYPKNIEDKDGDIVTVHYGNYTDSAYITLDNGGQIRNCTSVPNKTLKKASKQLPDIKVDLDSSEPQVLIYHTHTTESFEPYTRDYYDKSFSCKTTDTTKNMVAVGNAICQQLEDAGISYLHDTNVHDYPSYNGSYQSSRETVEEILEKYPSIKIVLDVHRDGIEKSDGTRLAPIAEIDGKRAAQIMIISCCDDGDEEMPNYMENFKYASLLQSQLETDYEGLTRPVLFDYRHYNQDLSTGGLLIEVGSHGNSIDEAVYSGELVGKSIVNSLKKLEK